MAILLNLVKSMQRTLQTSNTRRRVIGVVESENNHHSRPEVGILAREIRRRIVKTHNIRNSAWSIQMATLAIWYERIGPDLRKEAA